MPLVTSQDGTRIAYETVGDGPPLILVDGALCYRDSGPMRPLADALKDDFTVYLYDRRGRGESGNTLPYAPDREVEDIEALLTAAGGSAIVYGCSSGGALALEAANRGAGISKLILYEIPFITDASRPPLTDADVAKMHDLVAADRRGEAVKHFMRMVQVPGIFIFMMRFMPAWKKLLGVAHTLPHDLAFVAPFQNGQPLPGDCWSGVTAPVLVADGGKSPAWMRNSQQALAAVLGADYSTLDGQTHMVVAAAQAPMIRAFAGDR